MEKFAKIRMLALFIYKKLPRSNGVFHAFYNSSGKDQDFWVPCTLLNLMDEKDVEVD